MKIYENIYIGNFIYQLGIEVGKKNIENMSSLNLFQQTPSDSILSDLIATVNNRFMIIEFKRDNSDIKERDKFIEFFLNVENTEKKYAEQIVNISQSCHYIGIGKLTDESTISFYEYINHFTEQKTSEITNFIDKFLPPYKDNMKLGTNAKNFQDYILFLQKIYEEGYNTSTGGIIVSQDTNGKTTMLPTDNIVELILQINKSFENLMKKEQQKPQKKSVTKVKFSRR